MSRHRCPGDGCTFCERLAEQLAEGDRDLDGSMANHEADRYERTVLGL